eukprot:5713282-Alexandrium_andersonii.AAC.1
MMSAGLRAPGHLTRSKSPERTLSCAQSCPSAKCRDPSDTGPAADANGGAAIGAYPELGLHPE